MKFFGYWRKGLIARAADFPACGIAGFLTRKRSSKRTPSAPGSAVDAETGAAGPPSLREITKSLGATSLLIAKRSSTDYIPQPDQKPPSQLPIAFVSARYSVRVKMNSNGAKNV